MATFSDNVLVLQPGFGVHIPLKRRRLSRATVERQDWKKVRLLIVELSVTKIRDTYEPRGKSWIVCLQMFQLLHQAGFTHAKVESRCFDIDYWRPKPSNRKYLGDTLMFFHRPSGGNSLPPVSRGGKAEEKYLKAWKFQDIMKRQEKNQVLP